jgi:malate synthase
MEVQDEEAQDEHAPAVPGKESQQARDQKSTQGTVKEVMVIVGVIERLVPGRLVNQIDDQPQPIGIREDPRKGH